MPLLLEMSSAYQRLAWIILAAAMAIGPVKAEPDAPLERTCTDMNGHTFSWHWSNAPFASMCTDAQPVQKAAARSASATCSSGCSDTALACMSRNLASDDHGDPCAADHAACLKACADPVAGK